MTALTISPAAGGEIEYTSNHSLSNSPIYSVVGILRHKTQAPIHNVRITDRVGNDAFNWHGAMGSKDLSTIESFRHSL